MMGGGRATEVQEVVCGAGGTCATETDSNPQLLSASLL